MDPIDRAASRPAPQFEQSTVAVVALWLYGRRDPLALLCAVALFATILAAGSLIADGGYRRGFEFGAHPDALTPSAERPPAVTPQRLMPIAPPDARQVNAARPILAGAVVPAAPFQFAGDEASRVRAIDCLAAAAWYEGGDNASLETSVIQVVLNRVRNPAFPGTVCGTVFQGAERQTGCQFTFTCDGSMVRRPSLAAWARARQLAAAAIDGKVDARVGYATHYHTDWVVPYWSETLDKIGQVGPHLFYRWRGFWGQPKAFRMRPFAVPEPTIGRMAMLSPAHVGGRDTVVEIGVVEQLPVVAAPLPEAIQLSGVREKSLRGATVRGQSPDVFFIQLDPARFAGNYATAALAICKGHARCTVLGWTDAAKMATGMPLSKAASDGLTFYYHRDSDNEHAYWNCVQIERPNKAQCLPPSLAGLPGLAA